MSELQIRIATKKDAEVLADLSRRTFYDSFAKVNTPENMDRFMNTQFTREQLIEEVGVPGNTFLLAYLDAVLAGYTRLCENQPPPELAATAASAIELVRIYSEQHAIGKGVGKALMQYCLQLAGDKNKEWIWLGVWEHNHRAIDFYTKWGFEKFGEHIFLVGDDPQTDWWMKRKV